MGLVHAAEIRYADRVERRNHLPRGCTISAAIAALSILLMFSTVRYTHHPGYLYPDSPLACSGRLGAGLPLPFLCDYSGGGSPPSSFNRIDLADFPYFSPLATLLDFFFYAFLVGMLWLIVTSLASRGAERKQKTRWAILLLIGIMVGLYSALIVVQATQLRYEETHPRPPPPFLPTSTPFGTPPPAEFTPVPTTQSP